MSLKQKSNVASAKTHSVYVVELDRKVWSDSWKIRKANPHYKGLQGCLYVGMTALNPNDRFTKHKSGHRSTKGYKISSWFVEKYGLYLRPSLYSHLNPLTRQQAKRIEKELALSLKRKGYAVWWN